MTDPKTRFICFSKNRPLQLHGYLSSLFGYVSPVQDFDVVVIYKSDPAYESAYSSIQLEFPSIIFTKETTFSANLYDAVNVTSDYIAFGCDDVIFTRPINLDDAYQVMDQEDIVCLTFRLGATITKGMFGNTMPQPPFSNVGPMEQFLKWHIDQGVGDWCYPWEVLGTLYRRRYVEQVISDINPSSPSQLEEQGSKVWSRHANSLDMSCWAFPRTVNPTVNIVQNEFANGFIGTSELSPEFLLECWNHNLRVDVNAYDSIITQSWRIGNFYLKRI